MLKKQKQNDNQQNSLVGLKLLPAKNNWILNKWGRLVSLFVCCSALCSVSHLFLKLNSCNDYYQSQVMWGTNLSLSNFASIFQSPNHRHNWGCQKRIQVLWFFLFVCFLFFVFFFPVEFCLSIFSGFVFFFFLTCIFFYWCFVVALVFSCCCCFGGNFWLFFWNKMFTPQVLSSCWKSSKLIQTPTKQTSMGIFPSFIQERTQTTKPVVIHCLLGSPFILKYLRSKASLPQKYSYNQLISRARYRCWYKSVQLL